LPIIEVVPVGAIVVVLWLRIGKPSAHSSASSPVWCSNHSRYSVGSAYFESA
jgi:hypothetical protein